MAVYAIQAGENGPVKLGKADNPASRLGELQVAHYQTLRLIRVWEGGTADESALHLRFADLHLRGDWFSFSRAMLGDVGLVEITEPLAPVAPPAAVELVDVGKTLRGLRHSRSLTQWDVAAETGISRSTIASIEAGHDLPGRDALLKLAAFFGVSTEYLCGQAAA